MNWQGVVAHYRDRLNVKGEPVTLLEGNTPLIQLPRLAEWACPGANLFVKYEGLNPTGSFKDRGMTAAITQAVHDGAKAVICASTGNTAASAAAYAARAGLKCIVLIPEGKVAMGKLAGSIANGAQVVQINGSFDDGLRMVQDIASKTPIALVNSVNPARLEGQKTASWEIAEALGDAPDIHCLPVGNAGNISAYWLGYNQDFAQNNITKLPMLIGGQAWGSAPIVLGHVVEQPETLATAIRIGNPARWFQAKEALADSEGKLWRVTDDEIMESYRALATMEGIFCEPSSAAGVAALRKSTQSGMETEGKTIVAVLTGHGLKDPDSALANYKAPVVIDATTDALLKVIE